MGIYYTQFNKKHSGLASKFRVNPNSCGNNNHYQDYLMFCAITDQKIGKGVTYVLIDENELTNEKIIIGFVTLKATSLIMSSGTHKKHLEGNPAIEISELAVDINFERQGFGTYLLNLAISIIAKLRNEYIGVRYIVLCADSKAVPFYVNNKFEKLADYYEIPRDGWNVDCIPMALRLPEN